MDNKELEKIYNDTYRSVYWTAMSLLKDEEDAQDIVQEAFLILLRKQPKFKDEQHKRSWLLRVTINLSKNFRKSFWNRNKTELSEDLPDISDLTEGFEIWQAVRQLPPKYRLVIELYYHVGCTIEEISAITGAPRSTVGSRLSRAKVLLKEIYKEE